MADDSRVFDRELLKTRRRRALARSGEPADFLARIVAEDLAERLKAVTRDFDIAVDLGGIAGAATGAILETGKVDMLIRADDLAGGGPAPGIPITIDAEILPFAESSLDLVVSSLSLQFVNDLPGTLVQIRKALRPDGLFLGTVIGGDTLSELRIALTEAEIEVTGGISPRVAPALDVRDAGALLQRAGFALPVVDRDALTVRYDTLFDLARDLRAMAAANCLAERRRAPTPKALFLRAAEIYAEKFSDPDGRIRATFEVISLSGWAPDESQQKPLKPGSARASLADALNTEKPSDAG
ncbi:class I SAM-dependent methyltransferase [Rhodobium gokarnense]|uniref:SAM-dependent methyltransferase n=1 Tax=Rhodobium gokarnense TaxID=364296 RepID=A0ABT3H921_9HYPH|nr:methyltransferase domain-containing protein [Rhodobium gokarnense]MCW2306796.1 SAM-dependent methyltransferase [Rhodobium gokarnense]